MNGGVGTCFLCPRGIDGNKSVRPEMNEKNRYVKIVEWSDENQCFIGSCPGLFYGGCHGDDEKQVFVELCELVDETIELYLQNSKPLPPATLGKDYANKMLSVA